MCGRASLSLLFSIVGWWLCIAQDVAWRLWRTEREWGAQAKATTIQNLEHEVWGLKNTLEGFKEQCGEYQRKIMALTPGPPIQVHVLKSRSPPSSQAHGSPPHKRQVPPADGSDCPDT